MDPAGAVSCRLFLCSVDQPIAVLEVVLMRDVDYSYQSEDSLVLFT